MSLASYRAAPPRDMNLRALRLSRRDHLFDFSVSFCRVEGMCFGQGTGNRSQETGSTVLCLGGLNIATIRARDIAARYALHWTSRLLALWGRAKLKQRRIF